MPEPGREKVSAVSVGAVFAGFETADFDAYAVKKWTSNAYTLARRTAKDKLMVLARRAVDESSDPGLGALELIGSDEMPSVANGRRVQAQWAYFLRDAAIRRELQPHLSGTDLHAGAALFDIAVQHQHAALALRLDFDGLSVGVEIAGKAKVDRENAATKLGTEYGVADLIELCAALPGSARIGVQGATIPALEVDAAAVAGFVAPLRDGQASFVAEVELGRDEVIAAGEAIAGTVVELVDLFAPIHKHLAWARDNDHTMVAAVLKKVVEEKQKQAKSAPPMKAGDRVVIGTGLFAGRHGYLAEVDAKGKAKVMVGPVSVSVEVKDLKAT
jgi:transcription antitermination factor NusG